MFTYYTCAYINGEIYVCIIYGVAKVLLSQIRPVAKNATNTVCQITL